ncbi:hypothetical protein GLE_4870 [Lysobacter enzymogenes]|uniref:Uncharacterized protein n=1 Tax=Lysobacter enzymogenes TaxID=69 RepID=A0A0S2DP42_LYSEN|nr:hypothetical protein GLE_4870 [Lysobacter enzymogenes]
MDFVRANRQCVTTHPVHYSSRCTCGSFRDIPRRVSVLHLPKYRMVARGIRRRPIPRPRMKRRIRRIAPSARRRRRGTRRKSLAMRRGANAAIAVLQSIRRRRRVG